ncbi:MAG: hypothetical protein ABIH85_08885 [Candidatus Omnitrophota bacterium]|nr:hypothetical protein [Candidatus Omnitrophota bacterium]MBU1894868.1 hypothetical protein [Candidatus Omnitrophota bacterium]
MAKEIFSSKEKTVFNEVASLMFEKYGIVIHLAEIKGNRWSYVSGKKLGEVCCAAVEKINISGQKGIIVYGNAVRDFDEKQKVNVFLEKIIRQLQNE